MPDTPKKPPCGCHKLKVLEPRLRSALESNRRRFGAQSLPAARSMVELANAYREGSKPEKAEPLYIEALKVADENKATDPALLSATLTGLGRLYADKKRFPQAERLLTRALSLAGSPASPVPDALRLAALSSLAGLFMEQAQYGKAEPLFKQALELKERLLGRNHKDLEVELASLGRLHMSRRDFKSAEPYLRRAVFVSQRGAGGHTLLYDRECLAITLHKLNKDREAELLYREVLAEREKRNGKDSPGDLQTLRNYAEVLAAIGRRAESEKIYGRIREIRRKHREADCWGCGQEPPASARASQ